MPRRPALGTSHLDTAYAAALAGLGIAGLPSFVVEDALLEHALERVLPQWHLVTVSIFAGMPTRKHVPARTRAFVDFLVADLRRRRPRPVAGRRRLRDAARSAQREVRVSIIEPLSGSISGSSGRAAAHSASRPWCA